MSAVLVVGGNHIDGIKALLNQRGVYKINHWAGRKVGDSHKIIPQNTSLVVLVTKFISHSFTHKIKNSAAKRGLTVLYTGGNGASQLKLQLQQLGKTIDTACRKTDKIIRKISNKYLSIFISILTIFPTTALQANNGGASRAMIFALAFLSTAKCVKC